MTTVVAAAIGVTTTASGWARNVRVRGEAQLHAEVVVLDDGRSVETHVRATDESGAALRAIAVELRARDGSMFDALPCPGRGGSIERERESLRLRTGPDGEACARSTSAPESGELLARFAGDALHTAAETSTSFDRRAPRAPALDLRFDPPSATVDLDAGDVRLVARVRAGGIASRPAEPWQAVLYDPSMRELARARADADGAVAFAITPASLGAPGLTTLRAVVEGGVPRAAASAELEIRKTSSVRLALAEGTPALEPGSEAVLTITAVHALGPVDEGVVEIADRDRSLASASVHGGRATMSVRVPDDARDGWSWSMRYASASEYLIGGPAVALRPEIAHRSWLSRSWFLLLVAGAGAWVFTGWRRSRSRPTAVPPARTTTPGIHVTSRDGETGHVQGIVLDAHDATPLGAVSILVRRPTLAGDGVVARVTTDAQGRFALDLRGRALEGSRIEAHRSSHASANRALPLRGTLTVALVTRRRALLDRLVRWTRRAGAPFDASNEPTPDDVRRLAGTRSDIATWADAVEEAAYGSGELDADKDARVRDAEPR